jgi:hypothetical protein
MNGMLPTAGAVAAMWKHSTYRHECYAQAIPNEGLPLFFRADNLFGLPDAELEKPITSGGGRTASTSNERPSGIS